MTEQTSPSDDLESALLQYVKRDGYQPVKPRAIAKKLGLDEDSTTELKRVIKRLVKSGTLAWGEKHLVKLADQASRGL